MVEVVLLDFGFRAWYCWISDFGRGVVGFPISGVVLLDFGKIVLCDDCLHSLQRLGGLAMIVLASFW
jgi:hypothetical protein